MQPAGDHPAQLNMGHQAQFLEAEAGFFEQLLGQKRAGAVDGIDGVINNWCSKAARL